MFTCLLSSLSSKQASKQAAECLAASRPIKKPGGPARRAEARRNPRPEPRLLAWLLRCSPPVSRLLACLLGAGRQKRLASKRAGLWLAANYVSVSLKALSDCLLRCCSQSPSQGWEQPSFLRKQNAKQAKLSTAQSNLPDGAFLATETAVFTCLLS